MRPADARFAAAVAATAGLFYLGGQFVWDDGPLIAQRLARLDLSGILGLWTAPVTESGPGSAYYRPVAMSLLACLGRFGPLPIHLCALLLHAASAHMLVRLSSRLRAPLLGGLVFAVHPLVGEVLGWSSALPDALAVFFGLLSVQLARRHPVLSIVALTLGIWSKETAAVVALLVALGREEGGQYWRPWLAAVVVGLSTRFLVGVGGVSLAVQNLNLIPDALGWAMAGLVWPFPLHVIRDVLVAPGSAVILGWGLTAALVAFAGRHRAAWAGLGLMLASHAVALPVVLDGYLIGARYSYPALVGAALWLASVGRPAVRVWPWIVIAMPALVFHAQDRVRWTSDMALFDRVESAAYDSGLAWHLWAMVNLQASNFSAAGQAFDRALASEKPYPGDETLRLVAWVSAGEHQRALAAAEGGPQEGLTAAHLAWWARAAWGAGDKEQARRILSRLRGPDGFDGPQWVQSFATAVFMDAQPVEKPMPTLSP